MRNAVILLLVGSFVGAGPALSQTSAPGSIPKIVQAGLDAYKTGGPDEAVRAWMRGSALEGSKDMAGYLSTLHQTQELYGNFRGYEPIGTRVVSSTSYVVYMTLDYDRGPLFAKFRVYRTAVGSILTGMVLNADEDAVLPPPPPLPAQ
jgi:hypothetical protein